MPLNTNALISQQPYDISIVLHMPRTPANLAAGNFMLDLALHGKIDTIEASVLKTLRIDNQIPSSAFHHSRRPAMLPYSSSVTDLASTLLHLPLHLVSFHDADSVTLTIPMFEELEFARGKDNIPTYIELEIQSQIDPSLPPPTASTSSFRPSLQLQVYSAKIVFQVRFHGLRYLVYNYRVLAFVIFTGLFYTTSISTLAVAWALIATVLLPAARDDRKSSLTKSERKDTTTTKIKQENTDNNTSDPLRTTASDYTTTTGGGDGGRKEYKPHDYSDRDAPTTFPSLGRNAKPLEYTPQTSELSSLVDSSLVRSTDDPTTLQHDDNEQAHAADNEDEEESEVEWQQLQRIRERMAREARQRQMQHDSGIGTSLESENATGGVGSGRVSGSGLTRRRSQRSMSNESGGKE